MHFISWLYLLSAPKTPSVRWTLTSPISQNATILISYSQYFTLFDDDILKSQNILQYIIHKDTIKRNCDWLSLLLSLFSFPPQKDYSYETGRAGNQRASERATERERDKFNEFGHVTCAYDYQTCSVIQRSVVHFVGGFHDRFFTARFEAVTEVLNNSVLRCEAVPLVEQFPIFWRIVVSSQWSSSSIRLLGHECFGRYNPPKLR